MQTASFIVMFNSLQAY